MTFALPALLPLLSLLTACASIPIKPISTAPHVELTRFMGPWYVIASIPTFAEKEAFSAMESYTLNPDGSIATTFTFHKGSFDGPLKTMEPTGFVRDRSNATWAMQFVWPLKATPMKLTRTAHARTRLAELHDYIAQHSKLRALTMVERILDRAGTLLVAPRSGVRLKAAFAPKLFTSQDFAIKKTEGLSFSAAVSLPIAGVTAWQALFEVTQLRAGRRLLLNCAAGAVGGQHDLAKRVQPRCSRGWSAERAWTARSSSRSGPALEVPTKATSR